MKIARGNKLSATLVSNYNGTKLKFTVFIFLILIVNGCHLVNDQSQSCNITGHYYSHAEEDSLYTRLKSESKYSEYLIFPDVMIVMDYQDSEFRSVRISNDSLIIYYPSGDLDVYKFRYNEETLVLSSNKDSTNKVLVQIQKVNKSFEEMHEAVHRAHYEKRRDSILNQHFGKHE